MGLDSRKPSVCSLHMKSTFLGQFLYVRARGVAGDKLSVLDKCDGKSRGRTWQNRPLAPVYVKLHSFCTSLNNNTRTQHISQRTLSANT